MDSLAEKIVRKLVWEDHDWVFRAYTAEGICYETWETKDGAYWGAHYIDAGGMVATLEAAQSAAQAHCASAVMSEIKEDVLAMLREGPWKVVPDEFTEELRQDATSGRQVLAFENGRYYNAWLEFEEYEGGWIWMDEADSEPNPSHYMVLPCPPDRDTLTKGSDQ